MAALFLPRDSPLKRDYLHDLCITPVFYFPASHYRSHCVITMSHWGRVYQLLGLPFRRNPKLRNARKTFSCGSAPALLPARFIFPLSQNWNVHSYKLTLYRLGWLSVFAITSTLCCAGYPFHSVQKPPIVYQDVLTSRDRQKEWTAVWEICSACVSYPTKEGDELYSLLGLPSDFLSPHLCHVTVLTICAIRT